MTTAGKTFFDTNILVYQFDHTAPTKQKQAQTLIEQSISKKQAVISSQVVQEFMNVGLGKFSSRLSVDELELVMAQILKPLCQHIPTFDFYERALTLYKSNSLSLYDALIIQAAIDLGCKTLYSEDLQDGQQFGTLTITNPFS
jgi:predicted nucleic acid-binding protein